ncbi:MAG TPA: class I SAM-dependent methyltransferase, partial [Nitrospinota bacterium]|nr:class I SAM-dependent methyltransferase [Nitrospinota bacterium]
MTQEPSTLLLDHLHLLPKGRVLDVAMGKGRNTLCLAERGFDVEGVDIDETSVKECLEEATKRRLKIKARVADLTNYRISPNSYDLVLCFNYLQRDLIPQMKAGLKKGGVILFQTFLIDQHIKFGKPKHKEYCFEHNELLRFFEDFRVIYHKEG